MSKEEELAESELPLDERCFRAGVKEGRRLETEANLEAHAEIAQLRRQLADAMSGCCDCPMFKSSSKELTQLRQSLAERDGEVAALKEENAEIWAKCPNEEWECTKTQRRLEAELTRLEEQLVEVRQINANQIERIVEMRNQRHEVEEKLAESERKAAGYKEVLEKVVYAPGECICERIGYKCQACYLREIANKALASPSPKQREEVGKVEECSDSQ